MTEIKFQPSLNVDTFFSEDLMQESERFNLFLKAYYEWLQTTKLTLDSISGTFVRDEEVYGDTSGSIGVVKEVGTNYVVVLVTSRLSFDTYEVIRGQTSGASATTLNVIDNVVRGTGNLLNNRYLETSIGKYQDYLRTELYDTLPKNYLGDKRLIASKFKNYFQSRSNEESYRFLFRLLYDEPVEFYYPGEDVLRPSDGNFEKTRIIRAVVTDRIFEFSEKAIRGKTSGSIANVVSVRTFFFGGIQIAEMTLKLVSGTFAAEETIEDINDTTLTTTLYGIISSVDILDGGSGYSVNDPVLISGDGSGAIAVVSSISDAPIYRLNTLEVGHGYQLGTEAIVNNDNTGGSGLVVRVTRLANTYTYTDANTSTTYTLGEIDRLSILNRGGGYVVAPTVTVIDTDISELGLLSDKLITIEDGGSNYGVGNSLIFTGGSGADAEGIVASVDESETYDFLFEDGFRMLSEDSYFDIIKNEDWSSLGAITRIELTNFGTGYEYNDLPTITVDTTTGSGANLIATDIQGRNASATVDIANNDVGIGAIRAIDITNFGINYTTATANVEASGDGNANLQPVISGLGIKSGNWVDDAGKLDYKFIQDSFYYQDFSYVIKSGLAFNFYKDLIKNTIHPSGLQPFGQIQINIEFSVAPVGRTFITDFDIYIPPGEAFGFGSAAVVSGNTEMNIEMLKIINTAQDLANRENREVVIRIEQTMDVSPTFTTQITVENDRQLDTIVQFLSRISAAATASGVYELDKIYEISTSITSDREVVVRQEPKIEVPVSAIDREIAIEQQLDIDRTINITKELVRTNIISTSVAQTFDREVVLKPGESVFSVPITSQDRSRINFEHNLVANNQITLAKEFDVKYLGSGNAPVGYQYSFPERDYGDIPVYYLNANTISEYETTTFDTLYNYGTSTLRHIKVAGTVSMTTGSFNVVGTGTSFTTDFTLSPVEPIYLIVNDEKFIINSITNDELMTVTVAPAQNYTNSDAYKEVY